MANIPISALPDAGTLTGAELVPVVKGGVTSQTTTQDIADLGGGAVDSVNGQTGIVVLTASDVGALSNSTPVTPVQGGTGLNSYAQGDIIYASAVNTLAKLAKDTNATRYLSNTGASNNPSWAQVSLSTGVTGTLPVGNGGTGQTTATAALNALLPDQTGHGGEVLTTDGSNASWQAGGGGSSIDFKMAGGYFDENAIPIPGVPLIGITNASHGGGAGTYGITIETDYFLDIVSIVACTRGDNSSLAVRVAVPDPNDPTFVLLSVVDGFGVEQASAFSVQILGTPIPTSNRAPSTFVLDDTPSSGDETVQWTKSYFTDQGVDHYDIYRIDAQTLDGTANFLDPPTFDELVFFDTVAGSTFTFLDTPPGVASKQYAYGILAVGTSAGELESNVVTTQTVV